MDVHVSHVYIDVFKFIGTQWKMFFWLKYFKKLFKTISFFETIFPKKEYAYTFFGIFLLFVRGGVLFKEQLWIEQNESIGCYVCKWIYSVGAFQTFRTSLTRRRQHEFQPRISYSQQRKRSRGSRWTSYRWLSKWLQYRMSSGMRKKRYTVPGFIDIGNVNPVSEPKHIETHKKRSTVEHWYLKYW